MIVFVGESGDTDYEGLLGGVHKTVVLKGAFNTAPSKLHSDKGYPLTDVVAFDSPNILQIDGCGTNDIQLALKQLGILKK
ncbi:sucrose phosphate synthase [Canna indica]|uniref:Sucrose phosphate synthase n=1 Tax=Canna indica TaxID=4628 RepID=A0AAQ3QN24_9LILI|nr:sucrose phosphate synthase [Canna indica]